MRPFAALALLSLFLAGPVQAQSPIFSNGFYFYPGSGVAYKRYATTSYTWVPGYTYCGSYVAGYYKASTSYSYAPVQVNPAAADAESQLIALAGARDKAVLAMAAKAQRSSAALALADKLGLSGNFNVPLYGSGIFPVSNYSTAGYRATSQVGSIGATVFGATPFSITSTREVYGDPFSQNEADQRSAILLNKLADVLNLSADRRTQLLGQLSANQTALAQTIETAKGRVGTTLAAGSAAAQALGAAQPKGTSETTTITGSVVAPVQPVQPVVGPPAPPVLPPVLPPVPRQPQAAEAVSCMDCHSAQKRAGKFDFEGFDRLTASAELRQKVHAYLKNPDANHRCPPGKPMLSDAQINEVFNHRAPPVPRKDAR